MTDMKSLNKLVANITRTTQAWENQPRDERGRWSSGSSGGSGSGGNNIKMPPIDLTGIDPKHANVIRGELERQFKQYPEILTRLKKVGVIGDDEKKGYKASDQDIAYVSAMGDRVLFNPSRINEINEGVESISQYTIPGVRAKVAHECGHLIDKCIQPSFFNIPVPGTSQYRTGVENLYREYRKDVKETGKYQVSRRATENREEFMAETYALKTVKGDNANYFTKSLASLLNGIEGPLGQIPVQYQ